MTFDAPYEVNAGQAAMDAWIQEQVRARLVYGFGDLDAPLVKGEYVHEVKMCAQPDCDWQLPIAWQRGTEITRLRGVLPADALIQQHLEAHVVQSWSASP